MNERPLERVGAYRLVERLGEGGMGVVYRACDERLGREVAVKVLKRELATDWARLQRYSSEARAMAAVSHPNIVAIYDVGTWDGSPFIVTELLEGESLRDRIRAGKLTVNNAPGCVAFDHDLLAVFGDECGFDPTQRFTPADVGKKFPAMLTLTRVNHVEQHQLLEFIVRVAERFLPSWINEEETAIWRYALNQVVCAFKQAAIAFFAFSKRFLGLGLIRHHLVERPREFSHLVASTKP